MIILGVDPGLTRCGVDVIEAGEYRRLSFIHVDVMRSSSDIVRDLCLLAIYNGLSEKMDRSAPDAASIERVLAQFNRNTVLGAAQAVGLAMLAAAQHNIPVTLYTPTEAKLVITGNGQAQKIQMERMVARILNLTKMSTPADTADALALVICHVLRPAGALQDGEHEQHLTVAQHQWAEAAQKSMRRHINHDRDTQYTFEQLSES